MFGGKMRQLRISHNTKWHSETRTKWQVGVHALTRRSHAHTSCSAHTRVQTGSSLLPFRAIIITSHVVFCNTIPTTFLQVVQLSDIQPYGVSACGRACVGVRVREREIERAYVREEMENVLGWYNWAYVGRSGMEDRKTPKYSHRYPHFHDVFHSDAEVEELRWYFSIAWRSVCYLIL